MIDFASLPADPAIQADIHADPALRVWWESLTHDQQESMGFFGFQPRPDRPDLYDEQTGFVFNRDPMALCLKGNASGGTTSGAFKAANFLLHQQAPPRLDTPFWVCSDTYEQVMEACWSEKLLGQGFVPQCEIDWDRLTWHNVKAGHPQYVPLKSWPGRPGKNWRIEFRSYDQGRKAFQARSIGGFWFSEQFPHNLLIETLRGCRDYMFPGGQFAEFTPIDPELCVWLEKLIERLPPGWRIYRMNTECNKTNLADGWFEQFFGTVPDEMLGTRMTGELAVFEGAIFQSFSRAVHVGTKEDFTFPHDAYYARGLDWGHSHPFACVWGYLKDGCWHIFDELWTKDQTLILEDLAAEIAERDRLWGWPGPEIQQNNYGPIYADPSQPKSIAAFTRYGLWTVGAINDVYAGIDTVRSAMKVSPVTGRPNLIIHPRCKHLIEENRKYRWDTKKRMKPVPLMEDEDTVCAQRYMLHTVKVRPDEVPATADYRPPDVRHSIRFSPQHESKLGWGSVGGRR